MSKISVTLSGLCPILFDRYAGNNNEQLPWQKKVYLGQDGKALVLPAVNIMSYLSAQNTESAPQRVMGKRWKQVAKACQSFVTVSPMEIPFLRNGKALTLDNSGIELHVAVARVKKGQLAIPNPKERPLLRTPWELRFTLSVLETTDLSINVLRKLFDDGGIAIGLGTFRGLFGKFEVSEWKETK